MYLLLLFSKIYTHTSLNQTQTNGIILISNYDREDEARSEPELYVQRILDATPKPKGRNAFTSIHVIAPPESAQSEVAEDTVQTIKDAIEDVDVRNL